jgi:hypothetical protein
LKEVGEGHGRHGENLEQCRETLRRKGNGMLEQLIWELERPHLVCRRRLVVITTINSDPVKGSEKPGWGVGWAHSTDDGKESKTLSEGRSPALLMRLKKVRVRECQKLITP